MRHAQTVESVLVVVVHPLAPLSWRETVALHRLGLGQKTAVHGMDYLRLATGDPAASFRIGQIGECQI